MSLNNSLMSGLTAAIPGLNIYFVVSMEPVLQNRTLRIGLEINACVNSSAMGAGGGAGAGAGAGQDELCIIRKPVTRPYVQNLN